MRHFPKEKNQKFQVFFEKNAVGFLSLRYSADFRRSRLVFLFFRPTTELTLYVPPFSADFNRIRGKPEVAGSSPGFSQDLFLTFVIPD